MHSSRDLKTFLREKPLAVLFAHHKPHIDLPGIEAEVLRWEAGK